VARVFVELLAPPAGSGGDFTIEIEGRHDGRLRVQLRGAPVPDLVALSHVVCGEKPLTVGKLSWLRGALLQG
jgi:hypothetical protein